MTRRTLFAAPAAMLAAPARATADTAEARALLRRWRSARGKVDRTTSRTGASPEADVDALVDAEDRLVALARRLLDLAAPDEARPAILVIDGHAVMVGAYPDGGPIIPPGRVRTVG